MAQTAIVSDAPFSHGNPGCNIRDMSRLTGKVTIITGGEGSIGMATARAFVAEGASVFLAGISEPDLKAGAAELGEPVTRPRSTPKSG